MASRRKKISRSRHGGSSRNPAERAGPDIGVLELHYRELPSTNPRETVTLVYLPAFDQLVRSAADSRDPAEAIARGLMDRCLYVILGSLSLAPAETKFDPRERRCGAVLIVRGSWAQPDYGPLLYDAGIELAARSDRGVMADRASVSELAQRIWRFYRDRRPDVESTPAPRACPAHGVDELDRVYWAGRGFPQSAFSQMRRQMADALRGASRATGLPDDQIAHLVLDAAAMGLGVALFSPPSKVVVRNPRRAVWLEGARSMNPRQIRALKRRLVTEVA